MFSGISAKDLLNQKWKPKERAVLTFILSGKEILLIHKKRGLGKGLINAPGGRIETGETEEEAAIRETKEEVNLEVSNLKEMGELNFLFSDGYSLQVTVFRTETYSGVMMESPEAKPFWTKIESIPYDKMWSDDKYWLPDLLNNRSFRAAFLFHGEEMMDKMIEGDKT